MSGLSAWDEAKSILRRLLRWGHKGETAGAQVRPPAKPAADSAPVAWIEVADLAKKLAAGWDAAIIDVRGANEFEGPVGHIAGAINAPLAELPGRLAEFSSLAGRSIVLVCHTDKRSSAAWSMLRAAGHERVFVLKGGMDRWNRESAPADQP